MDEKISLAAVQEYAEKYAHQLAGSFFNGKKHISGRDILELSEIKQVNLFVIARLLDLWKKESKKLKSPYFDYDSPEVTEALSQFQNTLSNHILISKENFTPLLTQAVHQTLYLILDPYDFYSDTLDSDANGSIRTQDLKNEVKYIKINKAPLDRLVARLEEGGLDKISGNEAFAMLDRILEEVNFSPEEIDPYLAAFGKITPIHIQSFYEIKPEVKTHTPPAPAKSNPPVVRNEPLIAVKEQLSETRPTLADNLAKQRHAKLKDGLTINQKFMFTKILFHGDFEIFSEAIERLDNLDNLAQAKRFLDDAYPDWDRESEEYEEFIELVERRFS